MLYLPHKFSESTNANIPVTKIEINPKFFECYAEMLSYIFSMFMVEVQEESFNSSRIDIAADIDGITTDSLLSMLRVERIRVESLSFFKGTIYAGSNPKMRIYNKIEEIKARLRKGGEITEYEKGLLESGKSYTRFEVQVRLGKTTLKDISANPAKFGEYFDRFQVFDFGDSDSTGVLQVRYKYINHKLRSELERYRNFELVQNLKSKFMTDTTDWFSSKKEPF